MKNLRDKFKQFEPSEDSEEQTRSRFRPENQHSIKGHFVSYLYVYTTDKGITLKELANKFKITVKDVRYHYKQNKDKLEERGIFFDEKKKEFYRKEWKFKNSVTGRFETVRV
ncbi:hypothetical protein [Bacillus sp. T33-2]|uniref:hypothetical protein n=1 Tax=Bacillus sp. T33-2 TaxID=2054168 RepID=UPI000C75666B|nr:hypothetical protein [Bacillus sp. T33-2]PLR94837.1 hypothetical protein CVD19_16320 [Bacillus sp. T33-2]